MQNFDLLNAAKFVAGISRNASPILRIGNLFIWVPSLSLKERETTPLHDRPAASEPEKPG